MTHATCPCIRRLPRLKIEGADLVNEILGARILGVRFDRLVGRNDAGGEQKSGRQKNERSSQR
ncbi:hypothetical protein [Bradyrhizobium sp. LB11.1]|uniref:hypothetical protein n=1 Tax=Bradyrhizobium sp. LB11.1 TaxID=3156326 RepID=UPI003397C066